MPDGKLKIYTATWEDFGGKTPTLDINDLVRQNVEGSAWLNQKKAPSTLEEKFGKIPSPIQGFQERENISFKTPEDYTREAIKERELPFSQRAGAKITDFLFRNNLNDRAGGDVIREIGTPIVSGTMRALESGEKGDLGGTALGVAGGTFGALMSPFTAIKMGTEKVAGETAGKVAEIGSLAFTGGIPLVVGYFASQGATELATKISEGLELTPKETETVQEVAGLTAFILGDKSARSFGKKVNTALGNKVKTYINELPEGFSNSAFRKGEGEAVPTGTYKDLLKGQDQQRVINNPPEKKAYQEPTEVLPPIELAKDTPSNLVFNESQIRDRIKEIDNEVRKAEKEGNETLYNELQVEKKRWQDKLPETKEEVVETPEIITEKEAPVSKREQQKQTLYDENKKVINQILAENKGLLTEREISAKLNAFVEQGKLKKKVSPESIKQIKQEWKDAQPKPEKQVVKATSNELGLKIPNELNDNTIFHYGKNAPVKLKDYINEHPEVIEKIKDLNTFEEVSDVLRKDWNERSAGVLSGKKGEVKIQETQKQLREPTEQETGFILEEFGNTGFTFRDNIDNYISKLKEHLSRPDFDKYGGEKRKSYQDEIKRLEEIKSQGYTNLVDYAEAKVKPTKTETKVENKPNILKDVENVKIGDAVLINYGDGRKYEGILISKGKKNIKVETTSSMYGKQELTFPTEKIEAYIPKAESTKADINKPAKDLLEKTTKEPDFDTLLDTTLDRIFNSKRTEAEILKDIEKAQREGLNNVGSVLGAVNTKAIEGYIELGTLKLKNGFKDFDSWSKEMIKAVGDDIRPHLRKLHAGLVEKTKIDDKPVLDWINKYKENLNLELKEIDGKIVDPNTGQEGAARHKAGREKSTIEFNANTQGATWYHELAHVINNKIRQIQPDFLKEFLPEIDKLVPASKDKPLNEKFADAFERIYTDPSAPRTRMANVLQKQFEDLPKSFELARRTNKELGFEKLPEREAGVREEKSLEWLEEKFDAPKEVVDELFKTTQSDLYKDLRDDGVQTFEAAVKEAARLENITEQKLLEFDPKTLNGRVFNKAEQVKIRQIVANKTLKVIELEKSFGDKLSTEQAKLLDRELLERTRLMALSKNNLREAARVLESERRIHRITPEEYELVDRMHKKIKDTLGDEKLSTEQKAVKLDKLLEPTLKDKLQYIWYNLALFNPLTDVANLGGNTSSLASVMIAHPISGTKAFKKAYIGQHIIDGLAFQNAWKILKGEQHTISKYLEQSATKRDIINPESKLGNIAKNMILPTERLKVEDALFRTFFEELAKEKTAKIRAKELGVNKKDVIKVYNDLITNKNSIDKLVTEWGDEKFIKDVEGIERWASKMVFQEALGEKVGRPMQRILNAVFPLNLLTIPFLRIAVNMGKLGLDTSPYGLAKLGARKIKQHFGKDIKEMTDFERKDLFQRAVMGTVFYGALTAILQDGTIELTGEAPKDKNIRDLWTKAGYQENSFVYNNKDGSKTNISFNNISPFNVILGGIGTLMTKAKYGKKKDSDPVDDALEIILGMANALGNQSFLQRSSQLLDILNAGDGDKLNTFLQQAIPAPSGLSLLKGSTDLEAVGIGEAPTIYETKGLGDIVKNRYGITEGLTPKSGVFGEDRKSTYQRFPFPTKRQTDKIAKFMLESNIVIDDPSKPKEGRKEIFTDEEFSRYNKLYRRNFYSLMNEHYKTLQEMEKDELYGQMMVEQFVGQIKEQARNQAKSQIKEKQ